jgi:uncharacterized caspase-like protein
MPSRPGSAEGSDRQERRFLIAAGTARYDYLPKKAQLPAVEDDLRLIVEIFTRKLGYKRVLHDLGNNPTTEQLRTRLEGWLTHSGRRASDVVVFYYSGHGMTVGQRKHYLLTSNSRERNPVSTAFPTESLVEMLDGTDIQQLLILLDTCNSGQRAIDFSQIAGRISGSLSVKKEHPSGIYCLSAGRPKDEADEGVFARALVQVLKEPTGPMRATGNPHYCSRGCAIR